MANPYRSAGTQRFSGPPTPGYEEDIKKRAALNRAANPTVMPEGGPQPINGPGQRPGLVPPATPAAPRISIADYGKQTPMTRVQPAMGDSIPMPQAQAARIGFDPAVTKGLATARQARIDATPQPGDANFKGPTIPAPADPTVGPARPTIPEYTASQVGRMTELNRQIGVLQALGQREGMGAENAQTLKDYEAEVADIKQRPGQQTLGERMKDGANKVVESVKGAAGNVAEELSKIKLQDLGVGEPKMQDMGDSPAKQAGKKAGETVKKTKKTVKEGVAVAEKGVGDFAEGYAEANPPKTKAGATPKDTAPPSEKAGNKVREVWDSTVGAAENFAKGLRRKPGAPGAPGTPEAKAKTPKVPGAPPGPVRQGLGMAGRGLGLAAVPAMADQIYREGPLEAGGQMLTGGLEAGADVVGAYQNMPPWEATKYAGRAALAGVGDMANDSLRVLTGAVKASNPFDPNAPSYDQAMEQIRADPSTRFGGIDALRETNRQAMSSAFTANQQQKRQNLDNTFGLAKQIGPVQPLQGPQAVDPDYWSGPPPAEVPGSGGLLQEPRYLPEQPGNFGQSVQPASAGLDLTRALGVTPAAPVPGLSPPEELLQQPYDFAFNQMRQATAGEQPVSLMDKLANGLGAKRSLQEQADLAATARGDRLRGEAGFGDLAMGPPNPAVYPDRYQPGSIPASAKPVVPPPAPAQRAPSTNPSPLVYDAKRGMYSETGPDVPMDPRTAIGGSRERYYTPDQMQGDQGAAEANAANLRNKASSRLANGQGNELDVQTLDALNRGDSAQGGLAAMRAMLAGEKLDNQMSQADLKENTDILEAVMDRDPENANKRQAAFAKLAARAQVADAQGTPDPLVEQVGSLLAAQSQKNTGWFTKMTQFGTPPGAEMFGYGAPKTKIVPGSAAPQDFGGGQYQAPWLGANGVYDENAGLVWEDGTDPMADPFMMQYLKRKQAARKQGNAQRIQSLYGG